MANKRAAQSAIWEREPDNSGMGTYGDFHDPTDAELALLKKQTAEPAKAAADSTGMGGGASSKANAGAAGAAVKTAAAGGSTADIASSGLVSYGTATVNPYAIAAGAGLAVLSASQKRKQAEEETKAKMKMMRIQNQQNALSKLMDMSNTLKRL